MFKWVKKLINQIARANDEAFHGKKVDCCDLNRQDKDVYKREA